jgi:SAM-dependent methyltransferase
VSADGERELWRYQWNTFEDASEMLFREWIFPNEIEDFGGKTVLDAGCGGGQHMRFIAPYATEVVGVDLHTAELAAGRCGDYRNITTQGGDLATIDLGRRFDIVYSIGVLHHTANPRASFMNLARHVRPGGRLILWVYSSEGNALNRWIVEPLKRHVYGRWPRPLLRVAAHLLTSLLYLPVHTVYRLPLRFLPYYQYFRNFRRLSYGRNLLNVFDKLNAPRTAFIRRSEVEEWFSTGFTDLHLSRYVDVSWRASGTRI